MRRGAIVTTSLLVGLLGACARRAPGPGECYDFARELVGVPTRAVNLPPDVASVIEAEATRCLTTPYDHKLIDCVASGTAKRRCLAEFELRTAVRGRTLEGR
jgi:hypothetical protein